MKTLTQYINDFKFINDIDYHFMLEYELRNNIRNNFNIINEKFGVYDGQVKFVIDLCKEIYSAVTKDTAAWAFSLEKKHLDEIYENVFFKSITVKYKSDIETGYIDRNNYDEKTKLMNDVEIQINKDEYKDYSSLVTCLCHELTHTWDTYNSFVKNATIKPSDISSDTRYINSKTYTGNNPIDICRRICNNIMKLEQNAYISELGPALELNIDKISNYNDALNIFKNTDVWKQYSVFQNYINAMINNNFDKSYINSFCTEYNKINKSQLSNNKILKRLKKKLDEIFKKICTLIPKIYYDFYLEHKDDNIKESVISGRQNNYIIQVMNISMGNYNSPIKNLVEII